MYGSKVMTRNTFHGDRLSGGGEHKQVDLR